MKRFYSFSELIGDLAQRDGVAIEFAEENTGICELTYKDFAGKVLACADDARRRGARVEVIYADHSVDTLVKILGDVIAGCSVVIADPMVPPELAENVSKIAASILRVPKTLVRVRDALNTVKDQGKDSAGIKPGVMAEEPEGELMFFTSGTTSRSKVVRLTSTSLLASAWSGQSMLACGPGDRILSILPLSHVFGFVCTFLWGLVYGATIALGRDVRYIMEDAMYFKPTILPAVPSIAAALLRFNALNPELRVILIGAAPCTKETADALAKRGIQVYLGYGLTETSSGIAITQDLDEPEAMYPCPGADIRIEADGEVSVATPCMMRGYLGSPEMLEGERFYTGDIGSFDSKGRLRLEGRKKDAIIMADGTKIYCPDYEIRLSAMSGCPDIAVVEVKGHAVLAAGEGSDIEALKEAVKEFNRTVMHSQQIFDVIDAGAPLPRTVTGKLKRYAVQEMIKEDK